MVTWSRLLGLGHSRSGPMLGPVRGPDREKLITIENWTYSFILMSKGHENPFGTLGFKDFLFVNKINARKKIFGFDQVSIWQTSNLEGFIKFGFNNLKKFTLR